MAFDKAKFIEELKAMTVLEVSELVKALEEEFGISAAAPVAAAPVAAAPTTVATTNDEKVVAAIVGAVVAMGYSSEQIASIRPTATSAQWRLDGRLSGRN